ncbi:MAG TPA: hypothetical protein P5250_03020 [Bacteroidales bacterium]|nr:hypothetical protein [Bacteroidales bacterium]
MKKIYFVAIIFSFIVLNIKSQGYQLKFNKVIDTALTFTIPCTANLLNGYFVDILTLNNDNTVTKINSIYIDWPQLSVNTGSSSCGSGGSGQFRLQPALKKNNIYTDITSVGTASGDTKFNGIYWATKGTTISVKASSTSTSYPYLSTSFNGKIRISAIEFLLIP